MTVVQNPYRTSTRTSVDLGAQAASPYAGSVAIGPGSVTTKINQVVLGTVTTEEVAIPATTDCTAADTGALQVKGGGWFGKDVRSGGAIIVAKPSNGAAFFLADSAGAFNFVSGTNNTGSAFVGCPTGGVFVGSAAAAPTYIVYNQNWLVKFDNGVADFVGSVRLTANLTVGDGLSAGVGGIILNRDALPYIEFKDSGFTYAYLASDVFDTIEVLRSDAQGLGNFKAWDISAYRDLFVYGTTDCTAPDTGAVQVQGGAWFEKSVGIGGSVFVSYIGTLIAAASVPHVSIGGYYSDASCGTTRERYKLLTLDGAGLFYGIGVSAFTQEYMADGGGGDKTMSFHRFHCSNNGVNSFVINGSYIAVPNGNFFYLWGDENTDGSVRISAPSAGVAKLETRSGGVWSAGTWS